MSTSPLRIGYVPEHFSSPILQLAAQKSSNIELVSCPSGTGQIMTAMANGEIDIAVALTEALITGIAKKKLAKEEKAPFKIVGTYVTSPLNWAVICGKESKYQKLEDLRGEKIGISRIGSGSQVMASYMALEQGWKDPAGKTEEVKFEVLDTFKNLRDGVNDGRAAAFMWEHFTTKPFLSEVRFIDHVLTPWSSWLIVASPSLLSSSEKSAQLENFLAGLNERVVAFDKPEAREKESVEFVQEAFGYPEEDVRSWFESVRYPTATESGKGIKEVSGEMVLNCLSILESAGVLSPFEGGWNVKDFVDEKIAHLV